MSIEHALIIAISAILIAPIIWFFGQMTIACPKCSEDVPWRKCKAKPFSCPSCGRKLQAKFLRSQISSGIGVVFLCFGAPHLIAPYSMNDPDAYFLTCLYIGVGLIVFLIFLNIVISISEATEDKEQGIKPESM